jgi:predicted protein tyrosine phosphatase
MEENIYFIASKNYYRENKVEKVFIEFTTISFNKYEMNAEGAIKFNIDIT